MYRRISPLSGSACILQPVACVFYACMPLFCTPCDPPEDWLQYDCQAEDIQVYINSQNLPYQEWCSAVFDLNGFQRSFGAKKVVYRHDTSGKLSADTLASWVTTLKPAVRGNLRGVLFYYKNKGWQRLQTLLTSLAEVRITII